MPDNNENKMRTILTQDEKKINDFVQTRLKKVLGDIKQLTEDGSDDLIAWSSSFSYLAKTYGTSSDEPFKWYKYYLREGKIPASVQLPLLMQLYFESSVDAGFVNILCRVFKNEPEQEKERRIRSMQRELKNYIDKDGMLCLYRGEFSRPFGKEDDRSRPIEKAFAFSLDEDSAKHYAVCWYPESAKLYTVQVPLEDVARYNLYEEDKPVIIIPQSKGGSMKIVSQRDVTESEYRPQEDKAAAVRVYHANFGKK